LEKIKSWKQIACIITLVGGVQFIIITFIAMLLYADGYSFADNYISHLGTTKTVEGSPNTIPRILFIITCVVVGISLIPFWIVITTLFLDSPLMKYISLLGSTLGLISSPFVMALAIYAADTHGPEHSITTRIFFLLFATAILIYSIAILLNSEYQNSFSFIGIGFAIIIVLFIFGYFRIINVIMQKIIVYGFIVWAFIQVINVWKDVSP